MGKMNQLSLMQTQASVEFIPFHVELGGVPTEIVWRNQLGGVRIAKAGFTSAAKRTVVIVLESGRKYSCHQETFGTEGFPPMFLEALRLAVASGELVELCVATNPSTGRGHPDFFCGLRKAGSSSGEMFISL